jgi:sec-independent protein translocase protein TatA
MWHWLIVLAIVLLLFGRGKIPELMGDVAKGIKSFKKGMTDEDETTAARDARDARGEPIRPEMGRTVDHKADETK